MKNVDYLLAVASAGTSKSELNSFTVGREIFSDIVLEDHPSKEMVLLGALSGLNLYTKRTLDLRVKEIKEDFQQLVFDKNINNKTLEKLLSEITIKNRWGYNFEYLNLILEFKEKLENSGKLFSPLIKYFFEKNQNLLEHQVRITAYNHLIKEYNPNYNIADPDSNPDTDLIIAKIDIDPEEINFFTIKNVADDLILEVYQKQALEFLGKYKQENLQTISLTNVSKTKEEEQLQGLLISVFSILPLNEIASKFSLKIEELFEYVFKKGSILNKKKRDENLLYQLLRISIRNSDETELLTFLKNNPQYIFSQAMHIFPARITEKAFQYCYLKHPEVITNSNYWDFLYFISQFYKRPFSLDFSIFLVKILNRIFIGDTHIYNLPLDKFCQSLDSQVYEYICQETQPENDQSLYRNLQNLKKIMHFRYRMNKEFNTILE